MNRVAVVMACGDLFDSSHHYVRKCPITTGLTITDICEGKRLPRTDLYCPPLYLRKHNNFSVLAYKDPESTWITNRAEIAVNGGIECAQEMIMASRGKVDFLRDSELDRLAAKSKHSMRPSLYHINILRQNEQFHAIVKHLGMNKLFNFSDFANSYFIRERAVLCPISTDIKEFIPYCATKRCGISLASK
jgi:hypothetical protein